MTALFATRRPSGPPRPGVCWAFGRRGGRVRGGGLEVHEVGGAHHAEGLRGRDHAARRLELGHGGAEVLVARLLGGELTVDLVEPHLALHEDRVGHGDREQGGEDDDGRSEEHTSELQSLMRISYAVFSLKKKKT